MPLQIIDASNSRGYTQQDHETDIGARMGFLVRGTPVLPDHVPVPGMGGGKEYVGLKYHQETDSRHTSKHGNMNVSRMRQALLHAADARNSQNDAFAHLQPSKHMPVRQPLTTIGTRNGRSVSWQPSQRLQPALDADCARAAAPSRDVHHIATVGVHHPCPPASRAGQALPARGCSPSSARASRLQVPSSPACRPSSSSRVLDAQWTQMGAGSRAHAARGGVGPRPPAPTSSAPGRAWVMHDHRNQPRVVPRDSHVRAPTEPQSARRIVLSQRPSTVGSGTACRGGGGAETRSPYRKPAHPPRAPRPSGPQVQDHTRCAWEAYRPTPGAAQNVWEAGLAVAQRATSTSEGLRASAAVARDLEAHEARVGLSIQRAKEHPQARGTTTAATTYVATHSPTYPTADPIALIAPSLTKTSARPGLNAIRPPRCGLASSSQPELGKADAGGEARRASASEGERARPGCLRADGDSAHGLEPSSGLLDLLESVGVGAVEGGEADGVAALVPDSHNAPWPGTESSPLADRASPSAASRQADKPRGRRSESLCFQPVVAAVATKMGEGQQDARTSQRERPGGETRATWLPPPVPGEGCSDGTVATPPPMHSQSQPASLQTGQPHPPTGSPGNELSRRGESGGVQAQRGAQVLRAGDAHAGTVRSALVGLEERAPVVEISRHKGCDEDTSAIAGGKGFPSPCESTCAHEEASSCSDRDSTAESINSTTTSSSIIASSLTSGSLLAESTSADPVEGTTHIGRPKLKRSILKRHAKSKEPLPPSVQPAALRHSSQDVSRLASAAQSTPAGDWEDDEEADENDDDTTGLLPKAFPTKLAWKSLQLSKTTVSKWQRKVKQIQAKAGTMKRVVPQMDCNGVPNKTSEMYWDIMAEDYDGEVQSTIDDDRGRVIYKYLDEGVRYVQEHCATGRKGVTALDMGCGVGKWVPALAARCAHVEALDISNKLLEVGRREAVAKGLRNVVYKKADLANVDLTRKGVPTAELVVCANVLISPEPVTCQSILRNIWSNLVPGGILLLLCPAAESAQIIAKRHLQWLVWRREHGYEPDPEIEAPEKRVKADIKMGVFHRDAVRTQHYTQKTLHRLCQQAGFECLKLEPVEYEWDTEFAEPTSWMGAPYPFDWLAMARKMDKLP